LSHALERGKPNWILVYNINITKIYKHMTASTVWGFFLGGFLLFSFCDIIIHTYVKKNIYIKQGSNDIDLTSMFFIRVRAMVLNDTSVISRQSVLFVKETEIHGENHRPTTSN
jgi:hypothetical protein